MPRFIEIQLRQGNNVRELLTILYRTTQQGVVELAGGCREWMPPTEYVDDAPTEYRCHEFCDPHMYESVQEIYRFSSIVHYELEVSFCMHVILQSQNRYTHRS